MRPILILLSFLALLSCNKKDDDTNPINGPEIEWIAGGTSITYGYSGGVVSTYYFHRAFTVLNGSGEVDISIHTEGENNKYTTSYSVESGVSYSIKVKGNKGSSTMANPVDKCMTVVFSSPNCAGDYSISVGPYVVSVAGNDQYYCPENLSFEDFQIQPTSL